MHITLHDEVAKQSYFSSGVLQNMNSDFSPSAVAISSLKCPNCSNFIYFSEDSFISERFLHLVIYELPWSEFELSHRTIYNDSNHTHTHTHTHIYIYVYVSSYAASKDFPDSLSRHSTLSCIAFSRSYRLHPLFIQNSSRYVLTRRPTPAYPWWDPLEYVTYKFVPTLTPVSCIVCSSTVDHFRDGK